MQKSIMVTMISAMLVFCVIAAEGYAAYEYSTSGNAAESASLGPADQTLLVSPDERVTFSVIGKDPDKKRTNGKPLGAWQYYNSTNHEQTWTITGKASFSNSASVKSKTIASISGTNVYVYVDSNFGAGDSITISMGIQDLSTNGSTPPDTGSDNDGAWFAYGWTLTFKTRCPTSLTCLTASCAAEKPLGTTYSYRADPDVGAPGRPDYQHATIHEALGAPSSASFNQANHLTAAAQAQGRTDAYWINFFWGTSTNTSFALDGNDEFTDTHSGGFDDANLKHPPDNTNLTVDKDQTYTCTSSNGNLNKTYTITRIYKTNGDKKVQKQ